MPIKQREHQSQQGARTHTHTQTCSIRFLLSPFFFSFLSLSSSFLSERWWRRWPRLDHHHHLLPCFEVLKTTDYRMPCYSGESLPYGQLYSSSSPLFSFWPPFLAFPAASFSSSFSSFLPAPLRCVPQWLRSAAHYGGCALCWPPWDPGREKRK